MRIFKAEETKNGHIRIHAFYAKGERDEFVAANPEHRRNHLFTVPDRHDKYKPMPKIGGSKVSFCFDKSNVCHGGY